jgi:class 3 adenylate cyclase
VETTDADSRPVLTGRGTLLLRERAVRPGLRPADRVLLTVLLTDLVASIEQASQLGDARWSELLAEHHAVVRPQLELFKGREVKTTGDGFLMTFDSPARAVGCARAIRDAVARLGLEVRAGIHAGECDVAGGDVAGVAVHLAARLQAIAQPREVLVSSTVKDLVAGSGIEFEDRGEHQLKGLPGTWRLCAVAG